MTTNANSSIFTADLAISMAMTILSTLVGVAAGVLTTQHYYRKGGRDLDKLVEELRTYFLKTRLGIRTLARGLQASNQFDVLFDKEDDPINIAYKGSLHSKAQPAGMTPGPSAAPVIGGLNSRAQPAGRPAEAQQDDPVGP